MKTSCMTCQQEFKIAKTGVNVIETHGRDQHPVRLWRADLYRCDGCGHEIINGFGVEPMSEDYRPRWLDLLRDLANDPDPCFYVHEFPSAPVEALQ